MVSGRVFLNDIISEAFIGINPDELLYPQKIEFGFEFEYAWDSAVVSDAIEDAVDYAVLASELKAFISKSKFSLLEKLAFELAKKVLEFSPKITKAKVCCKKINALPGTSGPGAEIELKAEIQE